MPSPPASVPQNWFARGTRLQHGVALSAMGFLLLLTFWLPNRVAPPVAWSDSYMFGFNNRVSEILFGLTLLLTAAISKGFGLRFPAQTFFEDARPLTTRVLWVCLSITALGCACAYWLGHSVGGIGDGAYFLDRIHLMMRGQVPFRDFEFVYGSLSLYGSIFLGRLFHIGPINGYYLLWALETLAGMALLWQAIRWIDLPAAGKRTVFLLYFVLLALSIPTATLNYCALRYTLPVFGLVAFCRLERERGRSGQRAVMIVAAWFLAALVMGLSPEEGLVFGVATTLYLPFRRIVTRQPFLLDSVFLLGGYVLLYVTSSHAGAFGTMKRFGAGAFNLPVYPGFVVLFGFAAMLGTVAYLGTGTLVERTRSNVFLLVLYSVGMLPGAMGRCDQIHIAGYLMAAILCALLLARPYFRLWRVATIVFFAIFLLWPFSMGLLFGEPILSKALLNHLYAGGSPQGSWNIALDHVATRVAVRTLGEQRGMAKMAALRASGAARSVDPQDVFPGASPVVAVPFEYIPNKLSNYQSSNVYEGYYMGLSNITVSQQIDAKIAELSAHPEQDLVVSHEGFEQCLGHTGNPTALKRLLEIPWVPQPRNAVQMFIPYCAYIQSHYEWIYEPSPQTFGYGLMRLRK